MSLSRFLGPLNDSSEFSRDCAEPQYPFSFCRCNIPNAEGTISPTSIPGKGPQTCPLSVEEGFERQIAEGVTADVRRCSTTLRIWDQDGTVG
jgi:hypothetical protein